ncbi:MAG: RNA methyltransferase [Bacteroidales bacterium]|nr:RNA methyltransferase [Bacteroidales bacterium]
MQKQSLEALNRLSVDEYAAADKIPVVVVLDNIRSLMNIGSVFRTADAFRISEVMLCGITATPPHREIQKTALGAAESVQWSYYQDTIMAIKALKEQGYFIIAIEQTNRSESLLQASFDHQKIAFVFGNEVNGVDDIVLQHCDAAMEIPQFGTKHSFNIAVCAGIVLWEVFKKRFRDYLS